MDPGHSPPSAWSCGHRNSSQTSQLLLKVLFCTQLGIFAGSLQGFWQAQGNGLGPQKKRSGIRRGASRLSARVRPSSPESYRRMWRPHPTCDNPWLDFRSLSAEQRRLPAPRTRELDHHERRKGKHNLAVAAGGEFKNKLPFVSSGSVR